MGCKWCGCFCCCWSAYYVFVSSFVSVLCPLVLGLLCWCTARRLVSVFFCFVFGAGSPWLVYCTLCLYLLCLVSCLVLGLLCWCTALCFCVCLFLFCPVFVLCWVLGWEFLFMVGRVRFPGEVGELAPYGGAPYLGWTHSAGLALYPRFG